mmetsp:Transcript_38609/g.123753  ORF Transcript_38609/g.123753 Transcript_38609/m.123753 type:complete len:402 (-) Transcript_38609:500-1705(-)
MPVRARRTARATARTAEFWPIIFSWSRTSKSNKATDSVLFNLPTGIPVQMAAAWATSSSVTTASSSFIKPWSMSSENRQCAMAPASSNKSIALSGMYRSLMYLEAIVAADSTVSAEYRTMWCSSYLGCNPCKISMVSATDGSMTMTGWNLRSRAASFSTYLRYSSSVVAPTHWSPERARAGFKIFAASMAPSAAPAPIKVWISSMNKIMFPSDWTSSKTFRRRSSNSPRYFVPANKADNSKECNLLFRRRGGTLPSTILKASPSAIAVFPTPGSPTRHGLDLRRRTKIWMMRSNWGSRPTQESSLPSEAKKVRSWPQLSRVAIVDPPDEPPTEANSLFALPTFFASVSTALFNAGTSMSRRSNASIAPDFLLLFFKVVSTFFGTSLSIASSKCSDRTSSDP